LACDTFAKDVHCCRASSDIFCRREKNRERRGAKIFETTIWPEKKWKKTFQKPRDPRPTNKILNYLRKSEGTYKSVAEMQNIDQFGILDFQPISLHQNLQHFDPSKPLDRPTEQWLQQEEAGFIGLTHYSPGRKLAQIFNNIRL
jgi:hypothetical protein